MQKTRDTIFLLCFVKRGVQTTSRSALLLKWNSFDDTPGSMSVHIIYTHAKWTHLELLGSDLSSLIGTPHAILFRLFFDRIFCFCCCCLSSYTQHDFMQRSLLHKFLFAKYTTLQRITFRCKCNGGSGGGGGKRETKTIPNVNALCVFLFDVVRYISMRHSHITVNRNVNKKQKKDEVEEKMRTHRCAEWESAKVLRLERSNCRHKWHAFVQNHLK